MSGLSNRWAGWQPTKATLFWSCAASVVATMIIGFTWGGWTTGGSAREMADDAAAGARHQLAAAICVDRFMKAPDVGVQLTALQDLSSYRQSSFIRDGSWALMPDKKDVAYEAANQCAAALAALKPVPTTEAAVPATVAQ
jgi:hypothetical protein